MPPHVLTDFFIATTGASASFIGLLFVAISFALNNEAETYSERMTKRILSESAYAALINIFFISLVGLIPDTNLGYVIVSMAGCSIFATSHFLRAGSPIKRNQLILFLAAVFYIVEGVYGVYLITRPEGYALNQYVLMTLFLFLFGISLARAWELTGIRNKS